MTEPLIDRGLLADVIVTNALPVGYGWDERTADAVLAYLRSVLTPEALKTYIAYKGDWGENVAYTYDGADLHRRIFGEDR